MSFIFMSCLFPLFGPNVFANDLRLDMPRLEVLKSYPITGERLIAAEIASPLLVISILEMLFATSASIMMGMGEADKYTQIIATPQFIVAVLLLTIPVCAVQLVIRNAIPVLFPAWAMRRKDEPRGFVMMGQRIITLAGNLIVLVSCAHPGRDRLPAVVIGRAQILRRQSRVRRRGDDARGGCAAGRGVDGYQSARRAVRATRHHERIGYVGAVAPSRRGARSTTYVSAGVRCATSRSHDHVTCQITSNGVARYPPR